MTDLTPEQQSLYIEGQIKEKFKELAALGLKHNLDITVNSPSGYHTETLVTRRFLIETLENYGWMPSDDGEWENGDGSELTPENLPDRDLVEAFEQHTGNDAHLGSWISSSALC